MKVKDLIDLVRQGAITEDAEIWVEIIEKEQYHQFQIKPRYDHFEDRWYHYAHPNSPVYGPNDKNIVYLDVNY